MPETRMDQPALPLNYYCRSARLCLKKAEFSRKAGLFTEELQNLKKFELLVLTTIPCHPNYHLHRGEAQISELQIMLVDVEKRIRELELDRHGLSRRSSVAKMRSTKSASKVKSSRGPSEYAPKKTRKLVKKTTPKKRPSWDEWSTKLDESSLCRSCGRCSPSVGRKLSSRYNGNSSARSCSRSPQKITSPVCKYLESLCATCRECDAEVDRSWRFRSPERTVKDRQGSLPKGVVATVRHSRVRDSTSSGSPISRALAPLEDDFVNLQAQVLELKGAFDCFKLRSDEEGRLWRNRTEGLEKEMNYLKRDTEAEVTAIKKSVQDDVKRSLDGLQKDLAAAEDLWALSEARKKENLEHVMNQSASKMEEFKEKINFTILETKALLMKSMDDKLANCMGGIKAGLRSDFDVFELGLSRDVEDLRREMSSKCDALLTEVELAGMVRKQRVENLTSEALDKLLPQKLEHLVWKERTMTDMKEALCLLWKEVESLTRQSKPENNKQRDQVHRHHDGERLKRGIESAEVRRGLIREAVERILPRNFEGSSESREQSITDVKEELRTLWSEVESLSKGKMEVFKEAGSEELHGDSVQLKRQLQYVRKEAMQARVDAEDVRKDCNAMKRYIEDLEYKLSQLDNLESLPQLLENIEETKNKMEVALSVIEKEKDVAVNAACEATSAASRAGMMVEDVIGCVSSERTNGRRKSWEFQGSLGIEKDLVAESAGALLSEVKRKSLHLQESLEQDICKVKDSFATEVRKMSMDLNQEKECAVAAATEVREKTQEFQQSLRDAWDALAKERDAASCAASEITSLAEKAEGFLSKLTKCRGDGSLDVKEAMSLMETELEFKGPEVFVRNLAILEARVKETSSEQGVLKEKLTETCRKVRKLESVQTSFARSVEELRIGTAGLEKSAVLLLPKFESATDAMKDLEKRVAVLEGPANSRKRKQQDKPGTLSLETKVITLENRIDHVASASYSNLRILDGKVEKLSVGVQSALDGTALIETKCSSLGEEVVKVFRMLLAARKENPATTKQPKDVGGARKRLQRHVADAIESVKPQHRQAPKCLCCNVGNRWTSPGEFQRNQRCPLHGTNSNKEVRKINLRLDSDTCAIRSESPIQCTIRTSPRKQQQHQQHQGQGEALGPFKQQPVQHQDETAEDETGQTNVRLESGGRIQVNLRHR